MTQTTQQSCEDCKELENLVKAQAEAIESLEQAIDLLQGVITNQQKSIETVGDSIDTIALGLNEIVSKLTLS